MRVFKKAKFKKVSVLHIKKSILMFVLVFPDCTAPFSIRVRTDSATDMNTEDDENVAHSRGKVLIFYLSTTKDA